MERNSESSKRDSACKKLLKALGLYRSPNHREEPKPVGLAPEMEKKQRPNKLAQIGGETKAGKKSGEDSNDVFTEYINRAKRKLGSISSKRHGSSSRGKENLKEDRRFSDYIIRARNKLRATSSTVGRSSKGNGATCTT